ncbi:T-cell surface glycoprotein CD4-like [Rana temporaria]|uniref:T-cell surface glycoprotein CD4-like n=1 Tax=Rana temporaria TaxID=8407 RepID=UPI001AAD8F2E|nr:T-cell surface glycoprotein CD4-like [Rana temporaria]
MKKGVCVCLLYLQTYLSLASGERFLYKAGDRVTVPCGMNSPGDIEWKKNGTRIIKIEKGKTILGATKDKTNQQRFSVPDGATKDLQISDIVLIDSGNYSCEEKNKASRTVQVLVLQVDAVPSVNLLASEDLMLTIKLPPGTSPIVSWRRGQKTIADGPILKKDNVQIEDQGTYKAHVEIGDGLRKEIDVKIEVSGFSRSPSIVYISDRKRSLLLPWIFNFGVRKTPLEKEVRVLGGNVSFSSQKIKEMADRGGAGCWEAECDTKISEEQSKDLSFTLTNPKCGPYRMEIHLQLGARKRRLTREVCVSNVTVSASPAFFSMESNVTLACSVTCLDPEGKLCWGSNLIGQKVCGAPGQRTFTKNITAVPETLGNWTCNVLIGGNIAAGANLTLEVTLSLFHPSGALFWVTVAVGVVVLLLLAVIVAVMAARCRRVRRARYRAWLLENLHQQRVCECNGFAPKRLRENV